MMNDEAFKAELYRREKGYVKRRNIMIRVCISLVLCVCIVAGVAVSPMTPQVQAVDLLAGVTPNPVSGREPDDAFIGAQMKFSLDLLKQNYNGENILLSPLSASLALSMAANGAQGDTLAQMEQVLCGGLDIDTWNEYLKSYVNSLPTSGRVKLALANSIWYDNAGGLSVQPGFLQNVADYYEASVYAAPFNEMTRGDMNRWVEKETDGMIREAVPELKGILYLINALVFDGKWEEPYEESDVREDTFTAASGGKRTVDMMYSTEGLYLNDGSATGFVKGYKGGDYYFAALLPNYGTTLDAYLESLTWESLLQTLRDPDNRKVDAGIPKFELDCTVELTESLRALGMEDVFDAYLADLSAMAEIPGENLYIGSVDQITHITVDENGTKAAAVTIGTALPTGAPAVNVSVILDRPFLYMIVDAQTNLPVFIGTVTDIGTAQ